MPTCLRLFACLFLLALSACSQDELLQKFSTPEAQAQAKTLVTQLRARQFEAIEQQLDPTLQNAELRGTLEQLATLLPAQEPKQIRLVGSHRQINKDGDFTSTTLQYEYEDRTLLAELRTRGAQATPLVIGFHLQGLKQPLQNEHRFTLANKGAGHYLVLLGAICAPLFSLYALWRCIRTPLAGRKWPWVLAILFGVTQFSLNWTSGVLVFQSIVIQVLSASAVGAPYGPWTITFSLPLGALIFLLRRESLRRKPEAAQAVAEESQVAAG